MNFIKPAKYLATVSIVLTIVSIVIFFVPGPRLSIEFTGGTLMETTLPEGKTKEDIQAAIKTFQGEEPLENVFVSLTRDGTVMLRMRTMTNEEHLAFFEHLEQNVGELSERQFTTIGPTVGSTLKRNSGWALIIASIAIIIYIAFAFRSIPRKLSPWRFGVIAVITLLHDVMVTVGIFVILSHTTIFEFDTLFVTALLTIMGYSVNDTIVIFDRIRENLTLEGRNEDFALVAERSLKQSLTRSLNTGLSTLIMMTVLFFLGSESIRWFMLALIIGTFLGTYSSIFLAAPLLVFWRKRERH